MPAGPVNVAYPEWFSAMYAVSLVLGAHSIRVQSCYDAHIAGKNNWSGSTGYDERLFDLKSERAMIEFGREGEFREVCSSR